ncbi:M48 family peptidase, partial [bacterium]|nr:M48 family peptidase [bacterium]
MQYLFLVAYILVAAAGYTLKYLNLRHLERHGAEIPEEFACLIDGGLLKKTRDYTVENTRFGFLESAFSHLLTLVFLFGGLLRIYNGVVLSLTDSFIINGVLFFLLLSYASSFLSIPFDLYSTFRIEKKYDFNTTTPRIWVTDLLKSMALSTILMGIILSVGFYLVQAAPETWWLWVWG